MSDEIEAALEAAQRQRAKGWELRAVLSLSRFWRDQGQLGKAKALLIPVYDWFTDGSDTVDLKEASPKES